MAYVESALAAKVDQALKLEQSIKEQKKALDKIKVELQTAALSDMENKNIKQVQFFGTKGHFEALYKEKLEIDNYRMLVRLLGDIVRDKVTRKVEVKFDIENRFKAALMTLLKGDYKAHDLDGLLADLGLDGKAIKTAKKKLKGEYKADKKTLEALGITGACEEELDAIHEVKNLERVQRFFDLEAIDLAQLKKALWLEETLSVALYAEEPV
ncbi:hypothetical protein [Propionispora vibrioides]|uniref:Uncharacterized protein n=1 Tax=Propionispora vibrioides TaxID=112903 RepID=A0A1H8U428_9FIRM|nr:hypothetical protein [Propionispora vibrioides]SEO97816.1 hypothetical protein SAMN04490178_10819 [Propionispora vibrioides]